MSGRRLPTRQIYPSWDRAPDGPEAGPRYVLRPEYFGSLIYDRETLQYVPYDAEATALLLARREGPAPAASEDASGFLRTMTREGLLDADGRLTARVTADRSAPDRLSAPLTVYLGATQGCNLACAHCQASSGPGPLDPFDLDLARPLFAELFELGCGLVHVTGGEPLLHPEFFPAVDEAFRWGLNVLLTTNGTLISDALAEELARRPFRTVSISLDGPDGDSHDALRGDGSLDAALRGLRRLAAHRPVGVTTTLTPLLAGRLDELIRVCEDAGAAALYLRPGLPAGRAAERPDLLPSFEGFKRTLAELDALQTETDLPIFHPPEVPHAASTAHVLERFGCVAGNLVCSVAPDGQVNPCALLGPSFDTGSLRDHSLHQLWSQGDAFVRLRALEGNPDCWSCRHYDRCGGGCRARALVATGDLEAPDPWCSYEPRSPEVTRLPTAGGAS
jgi:radical SAM protein with 4Fe4S-binding SPASM domain